MAQERTLHRSVAIRMKLPRAHSTVLREQDACEPLLFMSGHLRNDVVTVNDLLNIAFHVYKMTGVDETLSELKFLSKSARKALANDQWRLLDHTCNSASPHMFQIVYVITCESHFLLIWEFHKQLVAPVLHGSASGSCRTSQGFASLSHLLDCARRTERGVLSHFAKVAFR